MLPRGVGTLLSLFFIRGMSIKTHSDENSLPNCFELEPYNIVWLTVWLVQWWRTDLFHKENPSLISVGDKS